MLPFLPDLYASKNKQNKEITGIQINKMNTM